MDLHSRAEGHSDLERQSHGDVEGGQQLDEELYGGMARAPAMSILVQKGRLGCAVLQWQEQRILLLEGVELEHGEAETQSLLVRPELATDSDEGRVQSETTSCDQRTSDETHSDFFHLLILQYRPEIILISTQTSEAVVESIERLASLVGSRIQTRPSSDFSFAIGSVQLKTLLDRSNDGRLDRTDEQPRARTYAAALSLGSRIDLVKSQISVSAVAPLLQMVKGDRDMPPNIAIEVLFLDGVLNVPEDTIQALSILSQESHASIHTSKGREGLSVMTLLSLNSSRHSLYMLRKWLLFPLRRIEEIEERLDAVEALTRDERYQQLVDVRAQLSSLANVPRLVASMLKGLNSLSSWDKLFKSCMAMSRVAVLLEKSRAGEAHLLQKLRESVDEGVIEELGQQINNTIDWEDRAQGRVTLRRGLDVHLDELRKTYAGLPDLLDKVALGLRAEPAFAESTSLHVVYFPQIGYLIVMPAGEAVRSDYDPTLSHQFSSNSSVYLKNEKMTDLDHHLGDLASFIVDREIELLEDLQRLLASAAQDLLRSAEAMWHLDCLMAFARVATLYGYTRPRMVNEPKLALYQCRHPLKELADDSFVPNDIHLRGGHGIDPAEISEELAGPDYGPAHDNDRGQDGTNSVLIVTGANSSGKSCLLQQAGLAVFLAHCGSFVPAAKAEIGIFDKILTRMKQDESLASEGSSFAKELRQLRRAISGSTPSSLVLLDEVGKGCRADEGAGLFCAAITEFLYRREGCPIVLTATHHLEAITHVLAPDLPLTLGHMQTVLVPTRLANSCTTEEAARSSQDHLTYLYRLRPGLASSSFACHCASLCGVPTNVVERAREIVSDSAAACRLPREDEERLEKEEQVARAFVEVQMDRLPAGTGPRDVIREIAGAMEELDLLH